MIYSFLFLSAVIGYLAFASDYSLQGSFFSVRLFGLIVKSLLERFTNKPNIQITNNYYNQTNIFLPKEKEEEKLCEQEEWQEPNSPQSNPWRKSRKRHK